MTIRYDLIDPPADPTKAIEFLTTDFLPLVEEFWKAKGQKFFGVDQWSIQAPDFTQLWLNQSVVLIMAYEDDKPAGFIIAAHLQPLFYQQRQLQVDQWYGRTEEIQRGLFKYLFSNFKFFQAEALVVPEYKDWETQSLGWPGEVQARISAVYTRSK